MVDFAFQTNHCYCDLWMLENENYSCIKHVGQSMKINSKIFDTFLFKIFIFGKGSILFFFMVRE